MINDLTKPLRILHINLSRGFRGGERQTVLLIQELAKEGCIQALVCRKDSPMRTHLKGVKNLEFIASSNPIQGQLNKFNADISHAHEGRGFYWSFLHKLIKKTPYIITRRINKPVTNNLKHRISYKNAQFVVAISSSIKQTLDDTFKINSILIPSSSTSQAVNLNITKGFIEKFKNKIIIGHIGALVDKDKGQSLIIEAAKDLEKTHPELHFVLFGTGPDEQSFKLAADDLSNITFYGFVEEVSSYIAGLDIFIFPSRNEGLGSILLDVMNLKKPIIATNVGGIPDIITHNQTGILIEPNSSNELADAIVLLSNNENLRFNLVRNAFDKSKEYTPKNMAAKYLNLYKGL